MPGRGAPNISTNFAASASLIMSMLPATATPGEGSKRHLCSASLTRPCTYGTSPNRWHSELTERVPVVEKAIT